MYRIAQAAGRATNNGAACLLVQHSSVVTSCLLCKHNHMYADSEARHSHPILVMQRSLCILDQGMDKQLTIAIMNFAQASDEPAAALRQIHHRQSRCLSSHLTDSYGRSVQLP